MADWAAYCESPPAATKGDVVRQGVLIPLREP
jgi:hypothetical protein